MNQEMNRILANLSEEVQAERKKEAELTQSVAVPDLDPLFVQRGLRTPFLHKLRRGVARLSSATRADRAVLSEAGQWPRPTIGMERMLAHLFLAGMLQSFNLSICRTR